MVQLAQRSGPLPDAAEMEYYREKSPEVYSAIVSEFQANGEHRREMDRRSQSLDEVVVPELLRQDRLGIYFSFGIALAAMTAVTVAGIIGSTSAAIGTAIPAVMMSIPGIIRATKRRQDAPDDRKDDGS